MSKSPERPPPDGGDNSAAVRGAIDALVQGALVDLFQAYDVAIAPLPRSSLARLPAIPEVSAGIAFTRARAPSGRLTLSLPAAVLELTRWGNGGNLKTDWARELANQLMGRVKNRLLPFNVRVDVGQLFSLDSKLLITQLQRASSTRVYAGRTLRGEVVVTLDGMPDEAELTYVGAAVVPAEGEMLLF